MKSRGGIRLFLAIVGLLSLLLSLSGESQAGRFEGTEITVGVMDADAIGSPATAHARTWAEKTGGRVRVVKMAFDDLFDRFMKGISAKPAQFDVIFYAPAWAGDFYPHLAPVPARLLEQPYFDDIHETYRDRLMKWDADWIAVTVDGDLFCGYYRKDLFQDPKHASAFQKEYGYALHPPDTWKEYRDIAEYFTGKKGPDGKPLYGTTEVFAEGNQRFWFLFSRAAAYANHPDHAGAQFFDPQTMKARINNPAWVRAAREYAEILAFCPPGSEEYGLAEVREAFCRGKAAMTVEWGDTGQISADPQRSDVVGKVGFFTLPGTRAIWNDPSEKWEKRPTPHKVPFLAFGGWVASVPKTSAHQDAAWDYILWYGSPENSLNDVVTSGTGINPYRLSHFMSIDAWTRAFSLAAASEYLNVLRMSLDSPHAALDLRIPGFYEYTDALEKGITRLLSRKMSAQAALDQVADRWEAITDQYGREKQLAIYRTSMGISH